jgi:hypothetical protein
VILDSGSDSHKYSCKKIHRIRYIFLFFVIMLLLQAEINIYNFRNLIQFAKFFCRRLNESACSGKFRSITES